MTTQQQTKPANKNGPIFLFLFLVIWAAFVGAWLYLDQDPTELWLVNALSVPVTVSVDGEAVELAPESYESLSTGRGTFDVVVTTGGREIESETIVIPKDRDIALFNVLGAGWVSGETVWYTQYAAQPGDRDVQLYVYESFHDIERETVQYAFRPTPDSVSISSGSNRATVRWVGVGQNWNWRHTLSVAQAQGRSEAAALEARLAEAMPSLVGAAATGALGVRDSAGADTPRSERRAQDPLGTDGKPHP
ncbi:MAG: hypothetical protein ACJAYU_003185 [Bradymonadia bacterium]|jgi:hypothetical protein